MTAPTFVVNLPEKMEIFQMLVGYARVSTIEQIAGFEAQETMLAATGCSRIFSEMVSSVAKRDQLEAALDFVREGDTLVVLRLDRLARSTADLLTIVATLEGKGVGLRIADFGGQPIDTQSPSGRLVLVVMGAIAEFERSLSRVRQVEGIARAKSLGRYKGRAPTARTKAPQVRDLRATGMSASAIALKLSVSRASVYRILGDGSAP